MRKNIFQITLKVFFINIIFFYTSESAVNVTPFNRNEYRPALLRTIDDNFIIIYQSFNEIYNYNSCDLYITFSNDGKTWSNTPKKIVSGSYADVYPSLIQGVDGKFYLFFASNRSGIYRIYKSISINGISWSSPSALNIFSGEEITNPSSIIDPNGKFILVFQKLAEQSKLYLTTSDDSENWGNPVFVANGGLPSVYRHKSGKYFILYHLGTNEQNASQVWITSSNRLSEWGTGIKLSQATSSKGGCLLELANGHLVAFYSINTPTRQGEIKWRSTADSTHWEEEETFISDPGDDVAPSTILLPIAKVGIAWGNKSTDDFNILFDSNLVLTNNTYPPEEVSELTYSTYNGIVELRWKNPDSWDLAGISIRRDTTKFPQKPTDGIEVWRGMWEIFHDRDVIPGIPYYYTIFTFDSLMNYSAGKKIMVIPNGKPQIAVAWMNYSPQGYYHAQLDIFAYLFDPNLAADITRVELYYSGNPMGIYLENPDKDNLFTFSTILQRPVRPFSILLEIQAEDSVHNKSGFWPYLNVW